ncbi:hypothetical protein EWM64_g1090 [Hericium alpestre]|uniref:MIF4G domain-containing protein n=1 Tax=Hericium alpestre TaxID=135208 RepID=A0A4Z0A845_9AGAM|nr:hypothetical protein EWM64_g1090 [Hericium alpestre]
MSHERPHHGNRRRHHREDYDYHDRRRESYETPEQKLRIAIIKLGEVDAVQELPRLVAQIHEHQPPNVSTVSEGLRIGVTEQPYKIPYYAALLRILYDPPPSLDEANGSGDAEQPSLGRQVLDDFWKGFQSYLDKLAWREARLCIHFFAHLTVAKVITASSMLSLLQSFTAVLDEFGVSHGRAKRAALCAAEGLMRVRFFLTASMLWTDSEQAGEALKEYSAASVIEMITGLQTYNESISSAKWLVQPLIRLHSKEVTAEHANEFLESAVSVLKTLDAADFSDTASIYPQPYLDNPALATPFDLPSVLVPPEVIELDGLATDSGEDALVKKEEWPEYHLRLFDNDVTPDPATPAGYAIRSDLLDIIEIFEINRKECARLLIEYPKWTIPGTFRPAPQSPEDVPGRVPIPGKDWQLESTVFEAIVGAQLFLADPPQKSIYYIALITELCKLTPGTVGPAVGKSIRKLYTYLGEGLDTELARRFAEWFAIHMSNFGFQIGDLSLPVQHPKRVFIRRALDLEIRLSYHDRILKTLPEPFQDPAAGAMADQAPGPEYDYDDPAAPHHDAAQSVLNQLRGRAKSEDIVALLDSLKNTLVETTEGEINVDGVLRSIAVQSLLHIGARSFSHFLNAIERYIALLRSLTAGRADARADILDIIATFWRRNRQMVAIVFDKFMQYQIVDPTDVVGWVFAHRENGLDWDVLKGALDKANGRVVVTRKRVAALRKEEDDTRARAKAGDADTAAMEVDAETKQGAWVSFPGASRIDRLLEFVDDAPAVDSPALVTALKAFASLTREQKATLAKVLEGFVGVLHPDASSPDFALCREVISEKAWAEHASWNDEQWKIWHTWCWYKHFCQAYSPYLRNYSTTLSVVSLAKIESADDEVAVLMKRIWNSGTGQE